MKLPFAMNAFPFPVVLIILMHTAGCGSGLKYARPEIESFFSDPSRTELVFETVSGRQSAFYAPPPNSAGEPPESLVIAYPGIGSRALDWMDLIDRSPESRAGFLLIDYPGRGNCEGFMRPKHLPQTTRGALDALKKHFKMDSETPFACRLLLLGHSFGCGAALQVAGELNPRKIVLVAPFTTLRKALFRKIGPLAWLNPDQLDNVGRIEEICAKHSPPHVSIVHGSDDRSIPVDMGRELAAAAGECADFHEIQGAGHVDILESCRPLIFEALFEDL